MSIVKSDFDSFFGMDTTPAVPANKPSPKPVNAPSAPLVPVAAPKGKKVAAPKPVGTSLNNFVGWQLEGNKLKFANKTDARAHRLALNAAITYGRKTDEDFKNAVSPRNTTPGSTVYWSADIAHIDSAPLPSDLNMLDDGLQCGSVKLPYTGTAASHAFYEAVKGRINRMPAKKFISLGTGGVARALASVLGSEFNSFLDFVWFVLARAKVGKVHIALEEEMKSKVGSLLDLPNLIVSKESHHNSPKVHGTYIYLSRVPAAGLRSIQKGWRPFLPSLCGGEVFFGTSGVYNIDFIDKVQLDTWETPFVHWFNYFGCLAYAKYQHVRIEESASFSSAWGLVKKVNQGNVQQLEVGYADIGFGPGTISASAPISRKEYRCDIHPGLFTHREKPDPAPARLVDEDDPDVISHEDDDVIKSWTAFVGVPFDGVKVEGYWWKSACLRCNKVSFCAGDDFYQKSLVDVAPPPPPAVVAEVIPVGWDAGLKKPVAEDLSAAWEAAQREGSSAPKTEVAAPAEERTVVPPHYVEKKEDKVPPLPASAIALAAPSTTAGGKQVTMPLSLNVVTIPGALGGVHAGRITMDGRQIPFYVYKSASCFARLNNYKGLVIGEAKETTICGFSRHIALLGPDGQPFKLEGSLYGYVVVADKAVAVKITHTKAGTWYVNLDGAKYAPADYDGCKLVLASLIHHLLNM